MNRIQGRILGLLFILTGGLLYAQEGIISYLEGDVSVRRGGELQWADFGTAVREGDTVSTGPDSLAILELPGDRVVKLREETILTLTSTGTRATLDLNRGGVFAKVRKMAGQDFSVSTPSAVAGVRGTQFFMAYGEDPERQEDLWLCVNEGTVAVTIPATRQSVLVDQGEGISIPDGKFLTQPRAYRWTENLNWNTDPASGAVRDSTSMNPADWK